MKKIYIGVSIITIAIIICASLISKDKKEVNKNVKTNHLHATLIAKSEDSITVQDDAKGIYTFAIKDINASIGDYLLIEYTGLLNKEKNFQENNVIEYTKAVTNTNDFGIPIEWLDEGFLKNYYTLAYKKLQKLSLDEKIGQLFLVRYDSTKATEDLKKYHFSGFVFYQQDFQNKTSDEVKTMIKTLQDTANTALLTSVDEEGGKIIRVSSNPNLVSKPFKSSKELYTLGGFPKIREDTLEKSKILYNLGLNLNLAPVVDVSTSTSDYIYERSFGHDTTLTSTYAKTVIEASKETKVSYTLKHFPGYGNNTDTHTGSSKDTRTYESIIENDIPPFEAGINAGAEAVLFSHNIVTSIDENNPASLSASIHNILRNRLEFSGIIITDDIDMGATSSIENRAVMALLSGNDLIITTNYEENINSIKTALNNGSISEEFIDRIALRVLAWKYYKGLLYDEK